MALKKAEIKKPAQNKENIREIFIKEFTLSLIKNTEFKELKIETPQRIEIPEQQIQMIPSIKLPQNIQPQITMPRQAMPTPRKMPPVPLPLLTKNVSLMNLIPIINDPTVLSIECSGPGRPLLINRGGRIETTPIIMSKENIDSIMREISKQTRIPIISGVFKAALGNYLVTAVISDFVGTRFAIQKRMPFVAQY